MAPPTTHGAIKANTHQMEPLPPHYFLQLLRALPIHFFFNFRLLRLLLSVVHLHIQTEVQYLLALSSEINFESLFIWVDILVNGDGCNCTVGLHIDHSGDHRGHFKLELLLRDAICVNFTLISAGGKKILQALVHFGCD